VILGVGSIPELSQIPFNGTAQWAGGKTSCLFFMYYIYVLKSLKDDNLYIGQTNNLQQRIARHTAGKVQSTRHRRPLELLYFEEYETRSEAVRREVYLKSGAGHAELNAKLHRRVP
jgi:putative endonuclease